GYPGFLRGVAPIRAGGDRERGAAGRSGSSPIRTGGDRERGAAGRSGSSPIRTGEFIVTTSNGQVARYRPHSGESDVLAEGFDQLYGVAAASGGTFVAAELGPGRVLAIRPGSVQELASGLSEPVGVACDPDGTPLVSEAGAGRVVRLAGSPRDIVLDGLVRPQGILVHDGRLYVVGSGARPLC